MTCPAGVRQCLFLCCSPLWWMPDPHNLAEARSRRVTPGLSSLSHKRASFFVLPRCAVVKHACKLLVKNNIACAGFSSVFQEQEVKAVESHPG